MIPILFAPAENTFSSHGLGDLTDAVKCEITQSKTALSELVLQYPVSGPLFDKLQYRSVILVEPDPFTVPQPFRIYAISKPMNGLVTYKARHIAYDGAGIPVMPFTATSAADAASKMVSNAATACPFTLVTDLSVSKEMKIVVPTSLRDLTSDKAGGWMDTYGGEILLNGYTITLTGNAGADRGVKIRYGVDLIDLQQEESIANTYTGILPFYHSVEHVNTQGEETEEQDITVTGDVLYATGTFPVQRILPVDLSQYFGETPTKAQVNQMGATYLTSKGVGLPEVNLRLSYAQIGQDVRLHDLITVEFELMEIERQARVTQTVYDALTEQYVSIQVGAPRSDITDALADAGRLKKGTIQTERIASHSISGGKISTAAISERALAAYAVVKEKLHSLSVSTEKIEDEAVVTDKLDDEAVTTPKVMGHAVTWDLLELSIQELFVDVLNVNEIVGGVITSDRSVTCSTIIVDGEQFMPDTISFIDGIGNQKYFRVLRAVYE